MSATKRIESRRQRNRELGRMDAANRCAFCKRELPKRGVKMVLGDPRKFCSEACLEERR